MTVPVRGRVPEGRNGVGRDMVGRDIVRREMVGRETDPAALIAFIQTGIRGWWAQKDSRRLWDVP